MVRVSWKVVLCWTSAGAVVLSSLSGCSGDDSDPGTTSGGSAGTGAGAAAGSSGSAGSSGAGGSGGSTGGSGGTSSGGTTSTGGTTSSGGGGSGGSAPASNCGDLTCTSGQICIESESLFGGEDTNECAAPPDGCAAWMLCDCNIPNWNGSPIWGCAAFGTSTLYVYDLSCGDAPCDAGKVCLVDETGTSPPSCVDPPTDCTVDDTFCSSGCGEQLAEAAGLDYVSCRATSVGAGVTVAPSG